MGNELYEAMDEITIEYQRVHDQIWDVWMNHMLFTWHWWLDVALTVLPWVLWIIVRDRKNTHSLLYAGLFSMLVAAILDVTGVSQGGWNYNTLLLPIIPEYFPWDLSVMPVSVMLFYQFFPKINPWLKGIVFGTFASYIVEPLFMWLGIYEPAAWEHHYSLPIYFAIFMIGYWMYRAKGREVLQKQQ